MTVANVRTALQPAPSRSTAAHTAFRSLLSPRGDQDPFPLYETLRAIAPVLSNPPFARNGVVLSRYRDCRDALRNRALHPIARWEAQPNGAPGTLTGAARLASHWIVFQHGTRHTNIRCTIAPYFTRDRINGLRKFVEDTADRLIADLARNANEDDVVDLIETLMLPFPLSVIGRIIGIPDSSAQSLGWAGRTISGLLEPLKTPTYVRRLDSAAAHLARFFTEAAADRRADCGDDLISLISQRLGSGSATEGQELVNQLVFVFCAGFDSSTSFLGMAVRALLKHPLQSVALREGWVEPGIAVAELLRYDPPVHISMRIANEPVRIGDVDVPEGRLIWVLLGSANRDPELVDRPDQLDITRRPVPNLSFSAGPHFCLGSPLAMMEAEVLLPRLVRRFPRMRLAGKPRYRSPGTVLRGIDHLPVVLGPAA